MIQQLLSTSSLCGREGAQRVRERHRSDVPALLWHGEVFQMPAEYRGHWQVRAMSHIITSTCITSCYMQKLSTIHISLVHTVNHFGRYATQVRAISHLIDTKWAPSTCITNTSRESHHKYVYHKYVYHKYVPWVTSSTQTTQNKHRGLWQVRVSQVRHKSHHRHKMSTKVIIMTSHIIDTKWTPRSLEWLVTHIIYTNWTPRSLEWLVTLSIQIERQGH